MMGKKFGQNQFGFYTASIKNIIQFYAISFPYASAYAVCVFLFEINSANFQIDCVKNALVVFINNTTAFVFFACFVNEKQLIVCNYYIIHNVFS